MARLSVPLDAPCSRDGLTRFLTRPAFLALLGERVERAAQRGESLALHLLDVDALRSVNDRHGQRAGDDVLRGCAERVAEELAAERWRDAEALVGRYDGDALAVLAELPPAPRSTDLAEALRARIAGAPFGNARVTVSIGVAEHRIGESADELVARAERTLHLAKQFGADRVELSPRPPAATRRASVTALPRR
ncbi:MAG TPA: GGDEF domain-containing protein [Gammaproteobacteria bacterium]